MIHMFILMCFCLLMGVFGAEVKSVSVMEGDSVTLPTNIQRGDEIEWRFEEIRIARIKRLVNINPRYEDNGETKRFKDRLKMNNQNGDLTITNIRSEHTGLYQLFIADKAVKSFRLTAYALLPIPSITRVKLQCLSSKCPLLCSVINVRDVRDVSLSWYKGNSLLSSISESDPNIISISLPLEVEYQDNNTYSCEVSNPITNRTQHINIIHFCQPCSYYYYWVRSAVTVLPGVVFIVLSLNVLSYVIKSRRDKQKRKSQKSSATSDE